MDTGSGAHNGTLVGGTTWHPAGGQIAGALSFDGSTGYVDLGDPIIGDGEAFTITAWVNVPANTGTYIGRGLDGYGGGYSVNFQANGDDSFVTVYAGIVTVSGGAMGYGEAGPLSFPINTWGFVAEVWSPNAYVASYVNGVLNARVATATNTLRTSTVGMLINNVDGYIGGAATIDDVRVYNRVLSATEIAQIYYYGGGAALQFCNGASWKTITAN